MHVLHLGARVPVAARANGGAGAHRRRARAGHDLAPRLALLAVGGGVEQRVGRVAGVGAAVVRLATVRPVGLALAAGGCEALPSVEQKQLHLLVCMTWPQWNLPPLASRWSCWTSVVISWPMLAQPAPYVEMAWVVDRISSVLPKRMP